MPFFPNIAIPKIGNLDSEKERKQIMEYLYQLNEQLRFTLSNLDEENLSSGLTNTIDAAYTAGTGAVKDIGYINENIHIQKAFSDSLGLAVSNGETSSDVSLTSKDGTMSTINIAMSKMVSTDDLSTSGGAEINGDNITSGTIDNDRLDIEHMELDGDNITSGTIDNDRLDIEHMELDGSNIASGTIDNDRLDIANMELSGSNITSGTIDNARLDVANLEIAGGNITSGTIDNARIDVDNLGVKLLDNAEGTFTELTGTVLDVSGIEIGIPENETLVRINPTGSGVGSIGYGLNYWNEVKSNSFINASSRRYKQDIRDITDADLGNVDDIRPVSFEHKGFTDGKRYVGMIAEEMAETNPAFVFFDRDGRADGIDYAKLTVLLIREVQKLKRRVQELERLHE